jgi:hypothetical protein
MNQAAENSQTMGNFIIIPAHVLECADLTPTDKLLFGYINALSNQKGYCYANNHYLGVKTDLAKTSISRLITKLKRLKFVKVQLITDPLTHEQLERRIYPNNNPIGFESIGETQENAVYKNVDKRGGMISEGGRGMISEDHHNRKDLKDNNLLTNINDCEYVDNLPTQPENPPYQKPPHEIEPQPNTHKNMSEKTKQTPFKKMGGNRKPAIVTNRGDCEALRHQKKLVAEYQPAANLDAELNKIKKLVGEKPDD